MNQKPVVGSIEVKPETTPELKLDLGCGNNKREGFKGVDQYETESTDMVFDLLKFPWPIDNDTVDEMHCSHFFEHIPGKLRGDFMDECYRVMKVGAQMTIISPYWSSPRSVQDYSHEWPPIVETSFLYFNKGWRVANKLTHYLCKCDFDFGYGYMWEQEAANKNAETQSWWAKHYLNAVNDIQVVLTKRKPEE